jgi:hypothetical protein
MPGFGYAKIFEDIFYSSLAANCTARHLFADLCVMADEHGEIMMSNEAIYRVLNWHSPMDEFLEDLGFLNQPDEHSKNPDEEGRRIVKIVPERGGNCGWRVVSHGIYRDMVKRQTRREQWRKSQAKGRAAKASQSTAVNIGQQPSTHVNANRKQETGNRKQKAGEKKEWGSAPTGVDPVAWNDWTAYKGGKPGRGTVSKLKNKLMAFGTSRQQQDAVDHSIANGYKGLFEPGGKGNGQGNSGESVVGRVERINREALQREELERENSQRKG